MELLQKVLIFAPPLLIAVILHELAHGLVAERLGDPTARQLGRITLNPLAHIDLFMTILLPGMLILANSPVIFGGAKPVPVNPLYFANPRRGMAYVAVAGPLLNFFLAAVAAGLFFLLRDHAGSIPFPDWAMALLLVWCFHSVIINLVLGLFNLLPVPPLDGGRILVGFLPIPLARRVASLEKWGLLIVFALLYFGVVQAILEPVISTMGRNLLSMGF